MAPILDRLSREESRDALALVGTMVKNFLYVQPGNIDNELTKSLKLLAKFLKKVDRVALILPLNDESRLNYTHEWVSGKKYSLIDALDGKNFSIEIFNSSLFIWNITDAIPALDELVDRYDMENAGKRSSGRLYVSIVLKNRLYGMLGLYSFRDRVEWNDDEVKLISLVGEIIAIALQKRRAEYEILEKQRYFTEIVKKLPIGLHIYENAGDGLEIAWTNPAADEILGIKGTDIIGNKVEDRLKFLVQEGTLDMLQAMSILGGSISRKNVVLRTPLCTNPRYLEVFAFQARKDEVVVAFVDVTSSKKAELDLARQNQRLKDLEEFRVNFVATTTHELKQPLVSIIAGLDFLRKNLHRLSFEEISNMLELMNRGSIKLKDLISDLLQVYEIETGRLKLEKSMVNLPEIIKKSIQGFERLLEEREQELTLDLEDPCELKLDPLRFEQVIANLTSNAIKNTPCGGKITIRCRRNGNNVLLEVLDTGIGITPEEMGLLFKRFEKIRRSENKDLIEGGTGLGLYITKEIVEAHGGKIWAESPGRNEGATFKVRLPASTND